MNEKGKIKIYLKKKNKSIKNSKKIIKDDIGKINYKNLSEQKRKLNKKEKMISNEKICRKKNKIFQKKINSPKKKQKNFSSRKNDKKICKLYTYKLLLKLLIIALFLFIPFYFKFYYIDNHFPFLFLNSNKNRIKIAFYTFQMKYGGVERFSSLLINLLSKEKNFIFYLITIFEKSNEEYSIPNNVKRIYLSEEKKDIFEVIKKEKIDILIYNFYHKDEIEKLNKLNDTKIIFINHSSYFWWLRNKGETHFERTIYKEYKNSKYLISMIPFENDYLFKKWGINSIFIDNPITYEYDSIIPSDLSQKNIIMIGRGDDPGKRFDLGIKAMKNIVIEIPECIMNIVSASYKNLEKLIKNLHLRHNIKITGILSNPKPYLKNASLHIFPSNGESYPMVLSEAKIFGIPTIICGLDYLALAKGGTIIIYDDNPDTIAKEAIKMLKDDKYRKKLGKEARRSMKTIRNKLIAKRWIKLLLSVYYGIDESLFKKLFRRYNKKVTEYEANIILNNQLNLLKNKNPRFKDLTLEKLKNYTFD